MHLTGNLQIGLNAPGWNGGVAPIDSNGNSALLDLQLLMAYESAEDLEKNVGMNAYATDICSTNSAT